MSDVLRSFSHPGGPEDDYVFGWAACAQEDIFTDRPRLEFGSEQEMELALAALGYEKRPWRHGNEGRYWKRIQSQEVLMKPCQTY